MKRPAPRLFGDLPRVPSRPTGGERILIFAPHPDDEVLGCGGVIIQHRELGNAVKVVVVTDGAQGDYEHRFEDIVALRQSEARSALAEVDVYDVEFWDYPDGGLAITDELNRRIGHAIREFIPTSVFVPSPLEVHQDHRILAQAVWQVWKDLPTPPTLVLYEGGVPLFSNVLVDISAQADRKATAIRHHRSQLAYGNYLEQALGRNRASSYSIPPATHAEAFFRFDSPEEVPRSAYWRSLFEGLDLDQMVSEIEERAHALEASLRRMEGHSFWRAYTALRDTLLPPSSRRQQSYLRLKTTLKDRGELVSIFTASFNHRRFLPETAASVLAQTYPRWEWMIIDDGSTDGSLDYLRTLRDPRIRVYSQPNTGRIHAKNRAVALSSGRYLVNLDSDDMLHRDYLKEMVGALERAPQGVGVAYPDVQWIGARDELWRMPDYSVERLKEGNFMVTTSLFKREAFQAAGGYNPKMDRGYEDWDLWLGMAEAGWGGVHVPTPLFFYRWHGENLTLLDEQSSKETHALVRKNHPALYEGRE